MLFTSINRLLLELITIILMITIAFKYKNIRYFLTNMLYTYILSILLGGLIYLFNSKVTLNIYLNYLVIIILSIEVMTLYIKENKKIKNTYNNYYKVNNTNLYISSGLGESNINFRLFNKPSINFYRINKIGTK